MYTNNTFFIILTLHNKGEEQFAIISILEDYEARHIACLQKFRKEFIFVGGKCEQHTSNFCDESTDQQGTASLVILANRDYMLLCSNRIQNETNLFQN